MKIQAVNIRPGHIIEHQGRQWLVLKSQTTQPGKGGAYIQVEMRDIVAGTKSNERWRTSVSVEKLMVNERNCTLLFTEGDSLTFMDSESYEQFILPADTLGESIGFLQDGMEVTIDFIEGKPAAVHLPPTVVMEVIEADAVIKGQTASTSFKPAKIKNGMRIMVPPHIEAGTRIVVNTEDGSYAERAKN